MNTKRSKSLDALYKEYLSDPESGLEPLLATIRKKAVRIYKAKGVQDPENAVQELLVYVWQHLPTLEITRKFSSWVNLHIRWHRLTSYKAAKMDKERLIFMDEDTLEYMASHIRPKKEKATPEQMDILQHHPDLLRLYYLSLCVNSLEEAAQALKMNPSTLRKKLFDFRHKR